MTCASPTIHAGLQTCKFHQQIPNGHGAMGEVPEVSMSDVEVTRNVIISSCLRQAK